MDVVVLGTVAVSVLTVVETVVGTAVVVSVVEMIVVVEDVVVKYDCTAMYILDVVVVAVTNSVDGIGDAINCEHAEEIVAGPIPDKFGGAWRFSATITVGSSGVVPGVIDDTVVIGIVDVPEVPVVVIVDTEVDVDVTELTSVEVVILVNVKVVTVVVSPLTMEVRIVVNVCTAIDVAASVSVTVACV